MQAPRSNSQLNLRALGTVGCAGVSKRSGLRGMRLAIIPALLWGGLWGQAGLRGCAGAGDKMHKPHSGSCSGFVAAGTPQTSDSSA